MRSNVESRLIVGVLLAVVSLTQTDRVLAFTTVPGNSNLWLAGMPDGATASFDVAPNHSPLLVTEIPIVAGAAYSLAATGSVSNGPDPLTFAAPEGDYVISHEFGTENGIAECHWLRSEL